MIVISAPMGAKGHQLGRLLASSDDVAWYNHEANGEHPWVPYKENYLYGTDANFTPFHWNRRFKGSIGQGFDEFTVPPVLDMAEKQGQSTGSFEPLNEWNKRVSPKHLLYALHGPLNKTKQFMEGAKHVIVIPHDITELFVRYLETSAKYYIDPTKKDKTYLEYFGSERAILEHLKRVVDNYSRFATQNDCIIVEVDRLMLEDNFIKMCNKLDIGFNKENYDKVRLMIINMPGHKPRFKSHNQFH